jgi:hypothetical protein
MGKVGLICLSLSLVSLLPQRALSQDLSTQFEQANQALFNGSPTPALERYKTLRIKFGVESPSLYYNAGIAAVRARSYGQAIWNFERALRRTPSAQLRSDIEANLGITRQLMSERMRISGSREQVFFSPLPSFWNENNVLTKREILYPFFCIVGLLGSLLWVWTGMPPDPKRRKMAMGLLFLFAVGGSLLLAEAMRPQTPEQGVMVRGNGDLYEASHESAASLQSVSEGLIVQIIDGSHPKFVRIVLPNGIDGWVKRAYLEEI